MNLFIIGNGFDSAHGIESSYEDFRTYVKQYESSIFAEFDLPSIQDGYREFQAADILSIIIRQVDAVDGGSGWKRFENTLGELDFCEYLLSSEEEDKQYASERNAENIKRLVEGAGCIKEIFAQWAREIDIHKEKKEDFSNLIDEEDLVLVFNYTRTIEELYGIRKNVFHIHGAVDQEGEIVVGHGNTKEIDDSIDELFPGSYVGLNEIKRELRKKVKKVLKSEPMKDFLLKVKSGSIQKVFSYGFAYEDVDMPYIEAICSNLPETAEWLFNDYDSESVINGFEQKLRKNGFRGKFGKFCIKK